MGRSLVALCAGFLALNTPSASWAQGEQEEVVPNDERPVPNDERPVPKDEAPVPKDEQPAAEPAAAEPSPAVSARPTTAPLRRHGLFLEGDIGVYFSFGGSDVELGAGTISDNSVGNLQPMAGLTAGYDLVHTEKSNLAVGLRFSSTFSANAAQVPDEVISGASTESAFTFPADVEFMQLGAALDYTYFFTERFGLKVHGDGGLGLVSPNPDIARGLGGSISVTRPNDADGSGARQVGVVFSGGLGVEYYTRLNGFAVGLSTAFYGVVNDVSFIPGLGIYVPLKYTF
ncbi:MAG: adventurous gliding motility protein CglE [Myxococcota bacterium]